MEDVKSLKMAVSLPPAEWVQSYIKEVPNLQDRLVDAGKSFQSHVLKKKWADWSLLPVAGWYAIASQLFDFKSVDGDMSVEEFVSFNMFIAAMAWSYEQRTYVMHNNINEDSVNKLSVLNLPSKALLNLTDNHKYGFYISLDNEILEDDGAKVHRENTEKDNDPTTIIGVMVVMMDEMSPLVMGSQPVFSIIIISNGSIDAITLRVGEWSIKDTLTQYLMEDNAGKNYTEADAAAQAESLAPILNVVMFFCTNQAEFLKAKDVAKAGTGKYVGINPDVRFLSFDSVLGEDSREWLAVESNGYVDVKFSAIN